MKTFKKISVFGAALLITATMGTAYAEDADMLQTRTQDRVLTEVNTQAPTFDFGQSSNKKQKMLKNQNQNQNQNQYRYMNNYRNGQSGTGSGSMNRQSTATRSMGSGRH